MRCVVLREGVGVGVTVRHKKRHTAFEGQRELRMRVRACIVLC